MKKIIVAIDGFSSTGKSTLAKQLAQKLDYIYIDSGAMYRAITYYFILKKVDIKNTDLVSEMLKEISIHFVNQEVAINDEIVEDKIRTMQIANMVSEVATIEQVRTFAVAQQQAFGIEKEHFRDMIRLLFLECLDELSRPNPRIIDLINRTKEIENNIFSEISSKFP